VETPLARAPLDAGDGLVATLRGRRLVAVAIRPEASPTPAGTTLRVELECDRRGSRLLVDVTAEAETVRVRVIDSHGADTLDRPFRAARRTDVDLLMEALEESGHDLVTSGALRAAAALVGDATA
jgi:hypothetical protein